MTCSAVPWVGEEANYTWYKNGRWLRGGPAGSLVLTRISSADTGSYHCRASGTRGSVTSAPLSLSVLCECPPAPRGQASGQDGAQSPPARAVLGASSPGVTRVPSARSCSGAGAFLLFFLLSLPCSGAGEEEVGVLPGGGCRCPLPRQIRSERAPSWGDAPAGGGAKGCDTAGLGGLEWGQPGGGVR